LRVLANAGRALWAAAGALGIALFAVPAASAPELELRAAMTCQTEPGSGRLLCTVSFEAPGGRALSWCDALVVSAPPAAKPLRSRVRGTGTPKRVVLGFVLGAGAGGRIDVLARAVACPAKGSAACESLSKSVGFTVEGR